MGDYRVEFHDSAEEEPCLIGRFATRQAANLAFEAEGARWRSLAARQSSRHTVSRVDATKFLVRSPSGRRIVYRVVAESGADRTEEAVRAFEFLLE